jgi:starvation-inducible outer membrane lipoprotein
MKISINKNQQTINFKTHVWTIIEIAKQKAEIGIERFYYPIPRNQGFSHWELIERVEMKTEESVYGDIRDGQIKFTIR